MTLTHDARQRRSLQQSLARAARTPFVWQLLALVMLSLGVRYWLHSQHDIAHTIGSLGILAPMFAVALQCATAMTPVGSSVIPTLNGMLFPVPLAMTLNMVAGLITGVGMYYLWRHGEREIQIQKRLNALPRWARRFARTDLLSLTVLRMLPWAGATVANLLAGTTRVPLPVHVASVVLGSLPGSIIYALLGAQIIAL